MCIRDRYWIEAEYALVAAHGGTWSDEHAHAIVGNALTDSARYIRKHGGVDLDPPTIVELLMDSVVQASLQSIPWRPGARELIADLAAHHVPLALVTMSYARLASTLTDRLPPGTFATVVTGDQVNDGKPHPEAYLTAMERLGVPSTCCVAIEDSPTGIASAEAAGAIVVAVPHNVAIDTAPGRVIVESLAALDVATLDDLVRRR